MPNDAAEKSVIGIYRRRVLLQAEGRRVFCALEDDFHHMYAELTHDGNVVTQVAGKMLRIPRDTCPGAIERLQRFVGMPLAEGARGIEPREQCTHLFDMTRLAMLHGQRVDEGQRAARRQYDLAVPILVDNRTRAEAHRDGTLALCWDIVGSSIEAPPEFACDNLYKTDWKRFDPDTLEAAMVLRRAVWQSSRRSATEAINKLKAEGVAAEKLPVRPSLVGGCYTFTPGRIEKSFRFPDTICDFTTRPDGLLAELAGLAAGAPVPRW